MTGTESELRSPTEYRPGLWQSLALYWQFKQWARQDRERYIEIFDEARRPKQREGRQPAGAP